VDRSTHHQQPVSFEIAASSDFKAKCRRIVISHNTTRPHFIIVDGCRTVSHVLLLFCRSIVTGQHAPTLPNGLKDSTAPV